MPKYSTIILAFILTTQLCFAQYKDPGQFIPPQFTILDSASGDLNKDGIKDMVLILKNNYETQNTDTTRPLLLLLGNKSGKYQLLARNDNVVLCMGCGGVFGDPYQGISIKNGYFSIEHYGGSSWRWTRIITFRFNAKTNQFILHRDAGLSWHASDPNQTTEKFFNKKNFGKLPFNQFSYLENR